MRFPKCPLPKMQKKNHQMEAPFTQSLLPKIRPKLNIKKEEKKKIYQILQDGTGKIYIYTNLESLTRQNIWLKPSLDSD